MRNQGADGVTPDPAQKSDSMDAAPELTASDLELLGWLTGALDPGEAQRLAGELASSPERSVRLAELRARLQEPLEEDEDELLVPPPGRATGRLPARASVGSVGFAGSPGRGAAGPARIVLEPPDAQERLVVVMQRRDGRWRVISPSEPEDVLRLSELPAEPGGYVLELTPDLDASRYAVALPLPGQADPGWDRPEAERWAALREGVNRAEIPVVSLDLSGAVAPPPRRAR